MKKDSVYLGSQSKSRRQLLDSVGIDYHLLSHNSDEQIAHEQADFGEYVKAIAQAKMESLVLPEPGDVDHDYLFILTADTLIKAIDDGQILGKPRDTEHAYAMIAHLAKTPSLVVTGCCIKKVVKNERGWKTVDERCWSTATEVEFFIPESFRDFYFEQSPHALYACGGGVIEGVGQLFVKRINGCYSSVLGLPLYELRQALLSMGFNFFTT